MEPTRPVSLARALAILAMLATAALAVVVLSRARPVLMPIAFAVALAFLLTPPMRWLQRRLPRLPSLAIVMLLAAGGFGAVGYALAVQFNDLTNQLGKYTESMRQKVTALEDRGVGPFARVEVMLSRVIGGLEMQVESKNEVIRVLPAKISPVARLWDLMEPLAQPIVSALFVLVLCIFMLGQRDDLRNRLIGLVGTRNVMQTTRTLDEGAQRITRYLLSQALINLSFGIVVGAGLLWIGIPYAALWGAVAALARFVPYVGAIASALLPAALAFAIFPDWTQTLLTLSLFIGLDIVTAYGVEPLVIGRRTGISSIALLVSALFWTWLWGPLGLILATPITVSLAVLGRHVPGLQFLAVLLGDAQVIGTEISFYQRLLARDEDEAGEIAQAQLAEIGANGVMDQIIIPTLVLAARDLGRKEITNEDETFILTWSRDIFEHLWKDAPRDTTILPVRALGIAAYRDESQLILEMLAASLSPGHGKLEILPPATILSEAVRWVQHHAPEVVCVAALPPEGGPHARQFCHQLKSRFPQLTILVFRPDEPGIDSARAAIRLKEAGADDVVSTLTGARAAMTRLLTRARLESAHAPAPPASLPRPYTAPLAATSA